MSNSIASVDSMINTAEYFAILDEVYKAQVKADKAIARFRLLESRGIDTSDPRGAKAYASVVRTQGVLFGLIHASERLEAYTTVQQASEYVKHLS